MSKIVTSKDSNGIINTLILEEGDIAVLDKLKNKRSGSIPIKISAVSVDGDTFYITKDRRIYEVQRKDLFKW